jgi:hypothetical protein
MIALLGKQNFGRGNAFRAHGVLSVILVAYLVCLSLLASRLSVLWGVSQIDQPQSERSTNSVTTRYNGQLTHDSHTLLLNNNANEVNKSGELQFIHERPVVDRLTLYLAIPTIPRARNADYLLQVLRSLENARFPLSHIYVFYNDNPHLRPHVRWSEGETLFSSKGVNFLWNNAPVPAAHPAAYNNSLPLPEEIGPELAQYARNDSVSRKDWRRKECNDFRVISQYMLKVVDDRNDSTDNPLITERDNVWIIFNQDDAQWLVEFYSIYENLNAQPNHTTKVDISHLGLVSAAFRAQFLAEVVQKAKLWCDFIPVDWMVSSFEDDTHKTAKGSAHDNWVNHLGKISTREGVVVED